MLKLISLLPSWMEENIHGNYLVILYLFGVLTMKMSLKTFILKILEVKPSGEEILNKMYKFSARLALTHVNM